MTDKEQAGEATDEVASLAFNFTSTTPGLRIYGRKGASFKFRGGKFTAVDEKDADDIRNFAKAHPQYRVSEDGVVAEEAPVEVSSDATAPAAEAPEATEATAPAAEADAPEEDAVEGDDYGSMTVPELQELARQRDLKVGGNKAALVARLQGKE